MAASSLMETARPPASSAGLVILEPLESRARLLLSAVALLFSALAAPVAAVFVLMTNPIISILDELSRHPCRTAAFIAEALAGLYPASVPDTFPIGGFSKDFRIFLVYLSNTLQIASLLKLSPFRPM